MQGAPAKPVQNPDSKKDRATLSLLSKRCYGGGWGREASAPVSPSVVNHFPNSREKLPSQKASCGIKQTGNKTPPSSTTPPRPHSSPRGGGGSRGSLGRTVVPVRHPRCYSPLTIPIICPHSGLVRQSLGPRAASCDLREVSEPRGGAGRGAALSGLAPAPSSTHSGT